MKIYSESEIIDQLKNMHAPQDSVVIMHSALRAIGKIEGGTEKLLHILIEYFTAKGGLFCVPTHTWHNQQKEITLDMTTNDHCLGAFATVALQSKLGIRSENPTHSMVVFGDREKAEDFIKNEPFIRSATAPEGCYGQLFSRDGYVLLVGVAQNVNTYLHAVDEILQIPNRMKEAPRSFCIRRENGEKVQRDIIMYHTDYTPDISGRFPVYDTAFRYHRCITDGFIGDAPTQLCSARKMKETVELIYQNSCGEDPLYRWYPVPQKWYCKK